MPNGSGLDLAPPPGGFLENVPRGKVYNDNGGHQGKRIHPYNRDDLCLTVQGGQASIGTPIQVYASVYRGVSNCDNKKMADLEGLTVSPTTIHSLNTSFGSTRPLSMLFVLPVTPLYVSMRAIILPTMVK
jgi:hypothetical protein